MNSKEKDSSEIRQLKLSLKTERKRRQRRGREKNCERKGEKL